jgi:hypothetical protein
MAESRDPEPEAGRPVLEADLCYPRIEPHGAEEVVRTIDRHLPVADEGLPPG